MKRGEGGGAAAPGAVTTSAGATLADLLANPAFFEGMTPKERLELVKALKDQQVEEEKLKLEREKLALAERQRESLQQAEVKSSWGGAGLAAVKVGAGVALALHGHAEAGIALASGAIGPLL